MQFRAEVAKGFWESVKYYWHAAVAWPYFFHVTTAVYVVGAIVVLFALMRKFWQVDAEEAKWRVPSLDPDKIHGEMQKISYEKRGTRVSYILRHVFFWPIYSVIGAVKKICYLCIYPFLLAADGQKTKTFNKALKTIQCTICGSMVPFRSTHLCRGNVNRPSEERKIKCDECDSYTTLTEHHFCADESDPA